MTGSNVSLSVESPGVVAAVARRIGWTDGQVYTTAIGLGVAVLLLLLGLPGSVNSGYRPAAAEEPTAAPTAPPPPSAGSTADTPATVRDAESFETSPSGTPATRLDPSSSDAAASPPTDAPGDSTAAPPPGDDSQQPPPDEPCPQTEGAQPVIDALAQTGVFPDQSTTLILSSVTGCSEADPAILLLGALAEFGSGLPDPGVDIPVVPVPYVELPPEIVEAVQPMREAIDPMCDAMGSVTQVFFYGFGTWPARVGPALGTPVSQVLLACGQIRAE